MFGTVLLSVTSSGLQPQHRGRRDNLRSAGAPYMYRTWHATRISLNRRFLIDGEHERILRRVQVKAYHIGRFGAGLRLCAEAAPLRGQHKWGDSTVAQSFQSAT
jgi:hypothetical protein